MGLRAWILVSVLLAVALALHPPRSQLNVAEASGVILKNGEILRNEAFARLNQLGKISDSGNYLQRTFLSPAAFRAIGVLEEWMQDAGLYTWVDDIGNLHGRVDGANPAAPALLIGSHMDTVVDAGRFDGTLGIVSAIAAVKVLHREGKLVNFPRPIEVIAFSDEEGIRFHSTFLGSGAIAGVLPSELLYIKDKSGATLQNALKSSSFKGTEDSLRELRYDPSSVWGYIEAHIEQGPVLEAEDVPLGVVEVIAGQTRLQVKMHGSQGHAGTVPMVMRRDPMPAAAQSIVAIEQLCRDSLVQDAEELPQGFSGGLVCTVGEIHSWPGASNVIPGEVMFTVDVRAKDDDVRTNAVMGIRTAIENICRDRRLGCDVQTMHEAGAVSSDKELLSQLRRAAELTLGDLKLRKSSHVPSLMSGAGHDAMAMAHLTKVGMLFVRCAGGISHSPAENVMEDDVMAAGLAMLHFLGNLVEQQLDNFL